MLLGTYLLYVLGAILPAFLFLMLFFSIARPVEFNYKFLGRAFLISTFSTQLVLLMHIIFPHYNDVMFSEKVVHVFFLSFVQVAMTEEVAKYITFRFTIPSKKHSIQPITIMLISMISAAAFATMENLLYLQSAINALESSKNSFMMVSVNIEKGIWEMLAGRAAFAVLTHLFCGAAIGYFTSIGMTQNPNLTNWFDKFVNKNRNRRVLLYSLYGIFIAVMIHGAYDFNIFIAKEGLSSVAKMKQYMYIMSGIGLFMIRNMILTLRDMTNQSKGEIPR